MDTIVKMEFGHCAVIRKINDPDDVVRKSCVGRVCASGPERRAGVQKHFAHQGVKPGDVAVAFDDDMVIRQIRQWAMAVIEDD